MGMFIKNKNPLCTYFYSRTFLIIGHLFTIYPVSWGVKQGLEKERKQEFVKGKKNHKKDLLDICCSNPIYSRRLFEGDCYDQEIQDCVYAWRWYWERCS